MTARPTSRAAAITLLSCATLGLAACGPGQGDGTPARNGGGSVVRAEAACDVKGVKAPLRRTVILVDAKALRKSDDGLTFAERNTAFRDLILSIADPAAALPAGTSAAREQIVIAVVPADGSAARTAFVGCIPGMSPQELAAAQQRESGVSSMFSSGVARGLEEQATNFRTQLIGGMVAAASQGAEATGSQSGTVDAAPFLTGVRASKGLFDDDVLPAARLRGDAVRRGGHPRRRQHRRGEQRALGRGGRVRRRQAGADLQGRRRADRGDQAVDEPVTAARGNLDRHGLCLS